jgi:hypothetical protein
MSNIIKPLGGSLLFLLLIISCKKSSDQKGFAGAVLMDLSKAFDCINHELLIAKLHAYGFSKNALKLIENYLSDRMQRVRVDQSFSSWFELLIGVPQGSVLGPILFNIYLNDLFFFNQVTDVCNFADDTTLHACDKSLENLIKNLEEDSELTLSWFELNYLKLISDKCQLLIAGSKVDTIFVNVGTSSILVSDCVKLLGVNIDNELKFTKHVKKLCAQANRKLTDISRYASFLSHDQLRSTIKGFVESQFKYCNLVWMFHSRELNHKINRVHERALRLLYNDDATFEQLLIRDGSFTVH